MQKHRCKISGFNEFISCGKHRWCQSIQSDKKVVVANSTLSKLFASSIPVHSNKYSRRRSLLWQREARPQNVLFSLIKELRKINSAGGFLIEGMTERIIFRPFVTHCSCDLPAKAMVQGITQFNGKYSCGYCLHPGVRFKNAPKMQSKKQSKVHPKMQPKLQLHIGTLTGI